MKKTSVTVLFLIFLLTVVGSSIVPNLGTTAGGTAKPGTTTTITSMRDSGNNVTDTVPWNRNFSAYYYNSGLGRNMPQNWSYTAGGTPASSSVDYRWTDAYGYSYGSGYVYFRTWGSGTTTWIFEWWQNFFYNGTLKGESPTSAYLSFRYYCRSIQYPTSSNYLRVYLQLPNSTSYEVWSKSITSSSGWTLVSLDERSLITQGGNGTYKLTLRYAGSLNQYGYMNLYWDDAGLAITHPPKSRPYDLRISINGGSVYANSTSLLLSPAGSGLNEVGFCNNETGPFIWSLFEPGKVYNWDLEAGVDGSRTVWYEARNTVGTSGPVNSSIVLDQHPPTRAVPASPSNGTAINSNLPTFSWGPATDYGPSGLSNYTLLLDTSESFSSGDLRVITANNTICNDLGPALIDGQWYWCVIAADKAGNVNASSVCAVWVDTLPPGGPGLGYPVDGDFLNGVGLNFTWSEPYDGGAKSSGIVNYTLLYSLDPTFSEFTTKTVNVTYYTFSSPPGNGTWYWRVFAYDRAGNRGPNSSNRTVNILTVKPSAPSVAYPRGESIESPNPILKWTPLSGTALNLLDYYIIEVDASDQFNNSTGSLHRTTIPKTGGIDLGSGSVGQELDLGKWYWRIRAVDRAGNQGNWSSVNSFTIVKLGPNPILYVIAAGGSGGVMFVAFLGYYFVRRSRIPVAIKKIDQTIKLIRKGEMPRGAAGRTRVQVINGILETKLAIMSKEKIEEAKGKKKAEALKETGAATERSALEAAPRSGGAQPRTEVQEADVDMIAKELDRLQAKKEKSGDESTLIKREIEELAKGSKKKKAESD